MEVYVEPVLPTPRLVIAGRSPMARTLADMAGALGWQTDLVGDADLSGAAVDARAFVVVATQGHGDEEALEQAVRAAPAYVGLVASRRRGEAVLGYLADRGVPEDLLSRVRVPAGLDLGHTSHREIAVAVLAEIVQLRAAGRLQPESAPRAQTERQEAIDPVCGMSVQPGPNTPTVDYGGKTFYFCSAGCRTVFEKDPASFVGQEAPC
jgi:xanthine dehydrogenase accessory factor